MKKFLAILMAALMIAMVIPASLAVSADGDFTLYIGTSGDDANDGLSADKPIKTFEKAVELASGKSSLKLLVTAGSSYNFTTATALPEFPCPTTIESADRANLATLRFSNRVDIRGTLTFDYLKVESNYTYIFNPRTGAKFVFGANNQLVKVGSYNWILGGEVADVTILSGAWDYLYCTGNVYVGGNVSSKIVTTHYNAGKIDMEAKLVLDTTGTIQTVYAGGFSGGTNLTKLDVVVLNGNYPSFFCGGYCLTGSGKAQDSNKGAKIGDVTVTLCGGTITNFYTRGANTMKYADGTTCIADPASITVNLYGNKGKACYLDAKKDGNGVNVLNTFSTAAPAEYLKPQSADEALLDLFKSNPELYKKALMLKQLEIIQGDTGKNYLSSNVTRAEMAEFIFRLGSGYTDISGGYNTTKFTDIPEDADYVSAVVWCYDNKIIAGRTATVFDPEADVSYDEAIKMVMSLLGYKNLSYPLGYHLKFRDLLKQLPDNERGKVDRVLANYRSDTVGIRFTMTRGEVVDLLDWALNAPLADSKGNPSKNTLNSTVWENAAVEAPESYIIVATETKSINGVAKAAKGKVKIAAFDAKKVISNTVTEVDPATYGIPTNIELLGVYFNVQKVNGEIMKELTTYAESKYAEGVSATISLVNNVKYVTVGSTKFAATDSASCAVTYIAGSAVPSFAAPNADLNGLYDAILAGREVCIVAYDVFGDGSYEYLSWTTANLGILGALTKKTADNDTQTIKSLNTGAVASIDLKRSELAGKATAVVSSDNNLGFFTNLVDCKCTAGANDIVAYYALGNKLVITEKLDVINGTIIKVEKISTASKVRDTYTIKTADGEKSGYTVATDDASNTKFANAGWCAEGISASLTATTTRNFIVYGSKIIGVFADDDAVVTPTYGTGTATALFYGLANRTITFSTSYEWDADKGNYKIIYTPTYTYNALVAYDNAPSTIVSVPVKADGKGIYATDPSAADVLPLSNYYPANATIVGTSTTEAPKGGTNGDFTTVDAVINGLSTDGSEVVTVVANKDSKGNVTDYTICKKATLQQTAANVTEQANYDAADEYVVIQNSVSGDIMFVTREDEDTSGSYTADEYTFANRAALDANAKIVVLTALKQDGKANVINAASGKKALYSASLVSASAVSIKENSAYVIPEKATLDFGSGYKYAIIEASSKIKTAYVLYDAAAAPVAQFVGTAPVATQAPYNYAILKSIDSFTVENKSATVNFTLYDPATGLTTVKGVTVTGTSDADALTKVQAEAVKLDDLVGKVVTVDNKGVWSGVDLAASPISLVNAKDNKTQIISGLTIEGASYLRTDGGNFILTAAVTATKDAKDYTEQFDFKLAKTAKAISVSEVQTKDTYFKYVDITATAVADAKGNFVDTGATYFVDSAANVAFGFIFSV